MTSYINCMVEVYAMSETKFAHFSIQELRYRSPAIEFFFITLISGVPRAKHRFSMWSKKGGLHISYSQLPLDNSTGFIQICTFYFFLFHINVWDFKCDTQKGTHFQSTTFHGPLNRSVC